MDCDPLQTLAQVISGAERCTASSPETAASKAQKSFEEATFFAAHFKDFTVRPMPDQPLMLILQKGKWRRKLRKISKKEKSGGTYMHKPKDKDEYGEQQNSL